MSAVRPGFAGSAAQVSHPADPIAIVGIGCRFPGGANDPAAFWQLLEEGRSAIREVPATRWNLSRYYHPEGLAPGTMVTRWGGFIDHLQEFDARFWGIAPREAARMDPQQRWLLEVTWEALEDGGVAPSALRGSRTGVFVGISSNDYGALQMHAPEHVDAYTNSGNTASIASNRISYLLDLRGPSTSVDTACSSALVAVWMACQSLWSGTCDAALAGGVNALIAPQPSIGFSKASMLSRSGQCFAFDARADGYVRAEGAGMVLLKPLARALADGDRVYAVIRGAAVNQDGHTASMTVPSLEGQAAMLRAAYAQAGEPPSSVVYVEAHGTGTPVGDPIEARALGLVLGEGRTADACLIGSVKTNIGHLEAASGMAGLIKGALIAFRRRIPASLNFERGNPHIPFEELRLRVASRPLALPRGPDDSSVIGVNSFGFGGTNAHVVLQTPPAAAPAAATPDHGRPFLLPISACDDAALREYARRYRRLLSDRSGDVSAICAAAATRKEHHDHRLVVIGRTPDDLRARLRAWIRDGHADGVVTGRGRGAASPVFVFTGQGAQWWGMGRALLDRESTVQRCVAEIDAVLRPQTGWSLLEEMRRDEAASNIDRTDVAQPAIFALQVALATLWQEWGVTPAAVIGHSVGELAAAYVAGIYGLDDAVRLVFHRSRLQQRTHGLGRMLAAALSAADARRLLAGYDGVELAAINSPQLVTLSGETTQLADVERRLHESGVFARWVRIEYPFHSRLLDPIRDELLDALATIRPHAARVPFCSTVTGDLLPGDSMDAGYWWRNMREPVLFADGISHLVRRKHQTFLEIGPHPALQSSVADCLAAEEQTGLVVRSLARDGDDSVEMLTSLGELHAHGVAVDWRSVTGRCAAAVPLPCYPWNRETFWAEPPTSAAQRLADAVHPLLGERVTAALPSWQVRLDVQRLPYLRDHRIWNRIVFPAAAFSEMALAVAHQLFPADVLSIEHLQVDAALFLSDEAPTIVQTVFDPDQRSVRIHSLGSDAETWTQHVHAVLSRHTTAPQAIGGDIVRLSATGTIYSHDDYRRECRDRGYQFGPACQQVQHVWRGDGEAMVDIEALASVDTDLDRYHVHPALLDACFHALFGLASPDETGLLLPRAIGRLQLHRPVRCRHLVAIARLVRDEGTSLTADLHVATRDGDPIADIRAFTFERVSASADDDLRDCYYALAWEPRHLRGSRNIGSCAFPPSRLLVEAVTGEQDAIAARHGLEAYDDGHSLLQTLVCQMIVNAFCALGWRAAVGDRVTVSDLVEDLGIIDEHRRATKALLTQLSDHGWTRRVTEDAWDVCRDPNFVDVTGTLDRLAVTHPAVAPDLAFGRRTGLQLAAVLSGEVDAHELLVPGGSTEHLERFYTEAAAFPAHVEAFRVALRTAVASLPPGRAIRVLEVGGGTGALTRAVLNELPPNRIEYAFTDVTPAFLASARQRLENVAAIEYRVFDLERDPLAQGLSARSFDLIVASNVLHVTSDIRRTLSHLRQCLAPGGLVLFMELVTAALPVANITFGLLKGWWSASDLDVRPDGPLLTRAKWLEVLQAAGFDDVATVSCTRNELRAEHATFIARAPEATPTERAAEPPRRFAVITDKSGVGTALHHALEQRGHSCVVMREATLDDPPALASVLGAGDLAGVIHCSSLDHAPVREVHTPLGDAYGTLLRAYRLVQAVATTATPVWFVSRNLYRVAAADPAAGLAAAPLLGLARVANNELQSRFRMIDVGACDAAAAANHVLWEVITPGDGEFETACRQGLRHALRLRRVHPDALPRRTYDAVGVDGRPVPYRLQIDRPGIFTNLALHETGRPAPGPGQVEVRVRAGGINFRDVMKALGTHPGAPADLLWFGDDISGVVERVGEGVDTLRPGDAVAGIAPYAFRSYALTDARLLFRTPAALSFEEAATVPTAFLTALYGLEHLARVREGERVLIHAAAGGVGLAAIQVAQRLSLEVFATAGTPEKRALLERLGVPHVMSSRTLAFADDVMRLTQGRGVDVVLNSLAGEFVPKSLSVLAPFGRFLEIGKVDLYRNAKLGLYALRNNLSFFAIDLTQHFANHPALVADMFRELASRFASGEHRPLPATTFPIAEAAEAFRFMAQGKHVGKNVLSFDGAPTKIAFRDDPGHLFRRDGTYLVTGGAGGFGLEIARWIAKHGGGHLVLMSRSGPADAAASAAIEALRGGGVTVVDARGDVSRQADVDRVVGDIRRDLPPLRGVFHAAMVMDDELIAVQNDDRVRRVLGPKIEGAWHLHCATRDASLEHFVCISSFSGLIALPKQSSYNAGNIFLDQLAEYRRANGLPALTVSFGALLGAGYLQRVGRDGESLAKLGFRPFNVDEALGSLGRLILTDVGHVGAGRIDWQLVPRLTPLVASSRTFASLVGEAREGERHNSVIARLRAAVDHDRQGLAEDFIASQIASVFGSTADQVDRSTSLAALGLDSLMLLELTNRVERELGTRIPMATLLGGPTVSDLAQAVLRLIAPALDRTADPSPEGPRARLATTSAGSGRHLVLLREGNGAAPVFCFHPVGGGVATYAPLAARLPRDVPVYGIESRLLGGAANEYATLDEMIDHYAADVRRAHPGPYRLLGFSLGGYLAAAVAERLEQDGAGVEGVGVLDWDLGEKATPEAQRLGVVRLAEAAYRYAQQDVGLVKPLDPVALRQHITAVVDTILGAGADGAEAFFRWVSDHRLITSHLLEGTAQQLLHRFEQHCRLVGQALPVPRFGAPLCLWRAREGFGSSLSSWNHPNSFSREYVVDGDHNTLIRADALERVAGDFMEFLAGIGTAQAMRPLPV